MSKTIVVALLVFVVACWGIVGFWLPGWSGDTPGTFGDQFGAVNALFSGLAFVGVIYAILLQSTQLKLQRKELELQREELRLQREELARSADAQAKLVKATHKLASAQDRTAKATYMGAHRR